MITLTPEKHKEFVDAISTALRRDNGQFTDDQKQKLYDVLQKQYRVSAYISDGDAILFEARAAYDAELNIKDAVVAVPAVPIEVPESSAILKTSALAAIDLGLHIFALGKAVKEPDSIESPNGFRSSTNDREKVKDIWTRKRDANIGVDCGSSDVCVFDFDVKEDIPDWVDSLRTLKIKTGKGLHVYTRGARQSKKMYGPSGKHIGEIKSLGGYTIWDKSVHPSGAIYQIVDDSAIAPTPDEHVTELTKHAPAKTPATINGDKIPRGQHDNELTRIAGKLRHDGMEENSIYDAIVEVCEKRCENYGTDYKEMCHKIANSVCRYEVGKSAELVMTQQPVPVADDEPEVEEGQIAKRPAFPRWVMAGTSLEKGLVIPACEHSSKYPELIFIPSVQLFLNAIALHVKLKDTPRMVPNMFVGVIAPYGQYFKSTCCELGHEYFQYMGLAAHYSQDITNAGGKTIITSIGSTEGLGKNMHRINAKKCILYFDELGKFAGKAGIENSSFGEDLLSFYEAGVFDNMTKDSKSNYNFDAKSYCFGWQFCTTDRAFPRHWSKLQNISSGLNDRMFFLLAPEQPKEAGMLVEPNLQAGALETRKLIDKAVQQGVYDYENRLYADAKFRGLDARGLGAAERLALYFAVDLGLGAIDDECVDRARALADYRRDVLVYLDPIEAETQQGKIQQEITRELRRNGGKMPFRELHHKLHGERLGSGQWAYAFDGLVGNGTIATRGSKPGRGVGQPKMVYLLKQVD